MLATARMLGRVFPGDVEGPDRPLLAPAFTQLLRDSVSMVSGADA